jgi:hypothetical protein
MMHVERVCAIRRCKLRAFIWSAGRREGFSLSCGCCMPPGGYFMKTVRELYELTRIMRGAGS